MTFLLNIIKIIFLLGFLIFIHEGGHFLLAKLFKVKVLEFAIGFGPTIWSKQGKETKYTLRLIPIGGFVNMLGEEIKSDDKHSYNNASIIKRILILLAGGVVNILFGVLIYFTIVGANNNYYVSTVIDKVMPNYAAEKVGLKSGDRILKVNDKKIRVKTDIDLILADFNDEELTLIIERENKQKSINIQPTKIEGNTQTRYMLGIEFKQIEAKFSDRLYYGYWETVNFVSSVLEGIKGLFIGKVQINQLSGPVGISNIVASTNNVLQYVYILAVISISLGMTNLLPFPPLDGGKIILLLIEAITKKPIKQEIDTAIQIVGMLLLLGLSLYVTYNDILRIF